MGVFAVRCPSQSCRKYMLVEEKDQGKTVGCLICKTPIAVPIAAKKATVESASARK